MQSLNRRIYQTALKGNEIRLLHIDSTANNTIQGRLETHTLGETGLEYIALSWCWAYGDTRTRKVDVNSLEMHVQANLVEMLRQVDQLSSLANPAKLPIWVDSICINQTEADQESKDELAAQIKLQGQIYKSAKSVFVWLGAKADQSDMFMHLLQYLSLSLSLAGRPVHPPAQDRQTLAQRCLQDFSITQDTLDSIVDILSREPRNEEHTPRGLEMYNHPLWLAWLAFGERLWFERQWILQEFVLCPSTIMICGDEFVDWRAMLFWTMQFLLPSGQPRTDVHKGLLLNTKKISMLVRQREEAEEREFATDYPLVDLLNRMTIRSAQAKRPHDYLYGLLGLLSKSVVQRVAIDYDEDPTSSVFMHATKLACFENHPTRAAASMWELHEQGANMDLLYAKGLCSWCPKLNNTRLSIRGEVMLPSALDKVSAGMDPRIIETARGRPGSSFPSFETVRLDVIELEPIDRVVESPFDATLYTDGEAFILEALKRPTASWLDEITQLWPHTADESNSAALFLEDFFIRDQPISPGVQDKMTRYQQLQQFVQGRVDANAGQQAIMNALHQVSQDPQIQGGILSSMSCLRTHSQSTYCVTRSGQFGRCLSRSVVAGDVVCIIPGAPWLHVFRKINNVNGRDIYRRVTIAWFSKWSTDGAGCWKKENLQELEIQ